MRFFKRHAFSKDPITAMLSQAAGEAETKAFYKSHSLRELHFTSGARRVRKCYAKCVA